MAHKPSKEERMSRYTEIDPTYVNAFLNLRCAPQLLELRILSRMTSASKEITKTMAVFRALMRMLGQKAFDDENIHCVVIEHAPKHSITGFLIGMVSKWKVCIVNPNNDLYKALTVPKNIWCVKGRIENSHLGFDSCDTLIVVTAHSIRGDFKAINACWDKIQAKHKMAVSLPLTAKVDCDGKLLKSYIDEHIVSMSNEVRLWAAEK